MALLNWVEKHGDFFQGKKAVVTGGAGFIGSHIAEALIDLGATVVIIDDLSGGETINFECFKDKADDRLTFIQDTILNTDMLKDAFTGVDYVFHQAALGSVPRSVEQPVLYNQVNTTGTQNVLAAATEAGVTRVMFAASSSAYGDSETLPKIENMPVNAMSPYAANKIACEALMSAYAKCYDIDTASLRYFNIFGPRQNANSAYAAVIAAFAKALSADKHPQIFGDGEQSRDFTFIDNVVHANLLAARSDKKLNGNVINIACGDRITVNQLAAKMAEIYGKNQLTPEHLEERAGDVKHSLADLTKTKDLIDYEPQITFDDGLVPTVNWYRSELEGTPAN
ncbi:NAD-dependent epimerase/dehydratase family protein [Poriferisphaera sp. WC338]|uniref:NAD-dependent epimerase/dehydratase family protein n=1 Tax=Poriferisphaera sp. WC338 TaxID=3425129 RepID=UPI003D817192